MSEDGKAFTGKWRYGSDGSWGSWDGGTRLTQVVSNAPPKDYGNASSWAVSEPDKAAEYGLIPDSLKSADLTKPITREAAVLMSVRTYDKVDEIKATKTPAAPVTPAPADPQTPPVPTEKGASNSLIGSWMYTAASGNVGLTIMMDFHADGTFVRALGSVAGYPCRR